MIKKIFSSIKQYKLLENEETIVLGFSGGPDSVFLLEVLMEYKMKIDKNLKIVLVHINHLLRGEASDGDEEFVKEIGKKYDLQVFIKRIDIEKIGKEEKKGLEEVGREVRHQFFKNVLAEVKGDKIALAHNKDDQIETFMFRIIRGTSLEGLEGIARKRDNYIRPIIDIYKSEIMNYLDEKNIPYRIDKTNFENEFTRNSIRLDLIPFIEKRYNPKFKDKIYNLIGEIKEVNGENKINLKDFLEDEKLSVKKLEKESKYIQKKILNKFLNEKKIKSDRYKIESMIELLKKGGTKKISLNKEQFLLKEYEYIYIKTEKALESEYEKENDNTEIFFKIPGIIKFGKFQITAEINNAEKEKIKRGNTEFLTNLTIGDTLKIRTKKPGDKIIPTGMNSEKKIKDILINTKIPQEQRDDIPIILKEEEVVWIGGVRGSEKYQQKTVGTGINLTIRRN
ncbi:MAG: tRNA lysidine(34) synthetase TilS [Fusobacteriaceae bacterium]